MKFEPPEPGPGKFNSSTPEVEAMKLDLSRRRTEVGSGARKVDRTRDGSEVGAVKLRLPGGVGLPGGIRHIQMI